MVQYILYIICETIMAYTDQDFDFHPTFEKKQGKKSDIIVLPMLALFVIFMILCFGAMMSHRPSTTGAQTLYTTDDFTEQAQITSINVNRQLNQIFVPAYNNSSANKISQKDIHLKLSKWKNTTVCEINFSDLNVIGQGETSDMACNQSTYMLSNLLYDQQKQFYTSKPSIK
jgi:hypothetical protein